MNADTLRQERSSERENGADRIKAVSHSPKTTPGTPLACSAPWRWLPSPVLLGTCLWLGVATNSTLQLGSGFEADVYSLSTLLVSTTSRGPLHPTKVQAVALLPGCSVGTTPLPLQSRPIFTSLPGAGIHDYLGPSTHQCSQRMLYWKKSI